MSRPDLSVVVAVQEEGGAVASLLAQEGGAILELILVVAPGCLIPECARDIKVLQSKHWALPFLLGEGLAAAMGNLIAVTEGHCTFAADWAQQAIAAHAGTDVPVLGGVVEPGEGLTALDWALYFCDYGQFLAPLVGGLNSDLPGNNIVFKRQILAGKEFTATGFWKTFFCYELQGEALRAEPALVCFYNRHLKLLPLLVRRWHHGRCFGAMRADKSSWSRKLLYALIGPLVPGLLVYKLWGRVWPKNRYRGRFLRVLPLSLLILTAWAVGEWVGNLFGSGGSYRRL
ncbi:glycosyltransferase family protein [Anthocerotibacter panamensis]|uniref:hypothetical protein n=1 Tax=Anthocerotibacter panamensis TaxID=2857077 RepID=UPI001C402356|nr:hypothetical protein [Anthocerotibacter panamensis]